MVKPTFICIGVQKSGTTSLINYLNQHPDIYMYPSEIHFFDTTELTELSIIQYENIFYSNKKIVGEKTPSYNYLQFAMDRIWKYNPTIKLILLLREPIARAFSQYTMWLEANNLLLNDTQIILDFEKEEHLALSDLTKNGNHFINRGKYDEIILYILSKFPRENVYIGISEEIKTDKLNSYNDIFRFLGATTIDTINEHMDTNVRKYSISIPAILEKKLYDIYQPHNERLYRILGRKIDSWEKYYDELHIK